jgi:hypothetical protein
MISYTEFVKIALRTDTLGSRLQPNCGLNSCDECPFGQTKNYTDYECHGLQNVLETAKTRATIEQLRKI